MITLIVPIAILLVVLIGVIWAIQSQVRKIRNEITCDTKRVIIRRYLAEE